jgi:hypothetical protein
MVNPARRNRSPLRLPVCLPEDALKPSRDAPVVRADRISGNATCTEKCGRPFGNDANGFAASRMLWQLGNMPRIATMLRIHRIRDQRHRLA